MGLFRQLRKRFGISRRLKAAAPVLVYQMGKVGSTSLQSSLKKTWPGLTIHTHTVARDLERNKRDTRIVYDRVIQTGGPLFVISPVRDPLGRNVSAFFQNFERITGVKYDESTFSVEELIRIFLQKFNHEMPLGWFDKHFKPILGLDVYDYDFSSSGVQVIHHSNIKLLLMRCELPDCVKESAVREFLNLPSFLLANANVGSQKDYAKTYEAFREAFVPPDWLITKMYESRFFNHFYGETYRNRLISEWTRT